MLDSDETQASPDPHDCFDPRRGRHPASPGVVHQISFHLPRDSSWLPIVPSDSAASHGVDRRFAFVPKATVHDHLPKSGDELDPRLSQFPLRDKHDRKYDVVPGSPTTHFARAGGLRCSMHRPSTLSLSATTAVARPTTSKTPPMGGACHAGGNSSLSS